MRPVIFQMMISLDGFFEGLNRELDWQSIDDDFIRYAIELLDTADGILLGRVTYQILADYWTTPEARAQSPLIAERINNLPKYVFSPTLDNAEWQNTRIVEGNIEEAVIKLKRQAGKNMVIFGSSELAVALTKLGLIDDYRIIVHPVVLGAGRSLLHGLNERLKLTLVETRTFSSGTVLLRYRPKNGTHE